MQNYQASFGGQVENHFNRKTENKPQPGQIWSGWYNQFTEEIKHSEDPQLSFFYHEHLWISKRRDMDKWKNEEWMDRNMAGPKLKQGWKNGWMYSQM